MSEKYITLNHLKTATKSLIAKIDEEINDFDETLSPVAKSGDYEDLENKPSLSQVAYTGSYEDLINPPVGVKYLNIDEYYTYADLEKIIRDKYDTIILYDGTTSADETVYTFYYLVSKVGTWRTQLAPITLTFIGETEKVTCTINSNDTGSAVFVKTPITTETPTPDWDQNDSTADDYIENRTHWKEVDEDFVWINESFVWNTASSKPLESKPNETNLLYFLNDTVYTVTYDGIDYQLTPYAITLDNGNHFSALGNSNYKISIWNVDGNHDTSVPFLICLADYTCIIRRGINTSDTNSHTISVTGPLSIYHKLNSNYLDGKLISSGIGQYSEVFNNALWNTASGSYSHAEGCHTTASGSYSHVEGYYATASGSLSHAEGYRTIASGRYSHAEGYTTIASGTNAHTEGGKREYIVNLTGEAGTTTYTVTRNTSAAKPPRFTDLTVTDRIYYYDSAKATAFTVGEDNRINSITFERTLNADSAWNNKKVYLYIYTTAAGEDSHAENQATLALGEGSHSEGIMTEAIGTASHAQNQCTVAQGNYQTAMGVYNIPDTTSALIVGNGNQDAYSNAYTLDWSGNGVYAGKVTVGTAPTADMDVATKLYVDTAMSNVSTDLVGLTDTTITTPTDGQILIYDATSSKWINSNFTAVSAESDTNVNDMLDDFSLDYTSDFLSPNMWVGGSY